jgi:AcrR family transcriptional regulator
MSESRPHGNVMQVNSHNESPLDSLSVGRNNEAMVTEVGTGRANQKQRTRTAIVDATRSLIRTGSEITMPAVAKAAMVSEATAYRYFPDLVSLLREAVAQDWPSPQDALAPVAGSADPVERVGAATEYLLREVVAAERAVRAMISASVIRPDAVGVRPVRRTGLIETALAPLEASLAVTDPGAFEQLKLDLAVIVSAEALFTLTDLCGLSTEAAIRSAVHTARTVTAAALAGRSS